LMRSREAADKSSAAFRLMGDALNTLEIKSSRVQGLNPLFIQGSIDAAARNAITTAQRTTGDLAGFSGLINSTNPLSFAGLAPSIQPGIVKASQSTKGWRIELQGVAQAFAQLAQVGGPALETINRTFGTVINSANAGAQLVESLAGAFDGLTKDGKLTGKGKAIASAFASFATGQALGGMTSNIVAGGALGAAGGLGTGLALGASGATLGLSVAVGAGSAIYAAWQNQKAQRQMMEQQRQSLIASMGGLESFQRQVERAGFSFEYFNSLFRSTDVDVYTDAVNQLNVALSDQRARSTALVKGLQEVARVQGVISMQQWAQIVNLSPDDEAAEAVLEFARQQRGQAETGITQAIAAIDTATAGGTQSLDLFQSSISAVTGSMVALFDAAVRSGESAVSVLKRLSTPMQALKDLLEKAGASLGDGFSQLKVLSDIATGEGTGPLVELAAGLGSALAGMKNSGMLSPELFGDLANGIGEAYHQLELMGQGGLEAARLMQPGLQAIWQMVQDNPALRGELDDTTLALLDFAEQAGLIGEDFRPAIDQMVDGLQELIAALREFMTLIQQMPGMPALPTVPGAPAPPGAPYVPPPPTNTPPNGGDYTTPFANGGIVTRATRALIGEAGPEAVIPLNRLRPRGDDRVMRVVVPFNVDGDKFGEAVLEYGSRSRRTWRVG
jgi:hypothetical protein